MNRRLEREEGMEGRAGIGERPTSWRGRSPAGATGLSFAPLGSPTKQRVGGNGSDRRERTSADASQLTSSSAEFMDPASDDGRAGSGGISRPSLGNRHERCAP